MGFPSLNFFSYDRRTSGVCLHPERTVWVVTRCAGQRLHERSPAAESLRCPQRWCESLRRGCISLQAWLSRVCAKATQTRSEPFGSGRKSADLFAAHFWISTIPLQRIRTHPPKPILTGYFWGSGHLTPTVYRSDKPSIREGVTMRSCLIWTFVGISIAGGLLVGIVAFPIMIILMFAFMMA